MIALMAALVLIGGVVAGILVLGKGGDKKDAKDKATPTPTATLPHRSVPTPSDGGSWIPSRAMTNRGRRSSRR